MARVTSAHVEVGVKTRGNGSHRYMAARLSARRGRAHATLERCRRRALPACPLTDANLEHKKASGSGVRGKVRARFEGSTRG